MATQAPVSLKQQSGSSLDCEFVYQALRDRGVEFFCGVPDSLLKSLCAYVSDNTPKERHVITANEGTAVSMATGYFLATGRTPVVYLQNSGLGNAINPMLSLADPMVYGIPMLLIIGWRGEPGTRDEPQHQKQGEATIPLLESAGVPVRVLSRNKLDAEQDISNSLETANENSQPVALLIRKGVLGHYESVREQSLTYPMTREEIIRQITAIATDHIIISTTGKTSRELYQIRVQAGSNPGRDFLSVGSMGHASQIAAGIALARPQQKVLCLDGDGALLMHLGGLATIGALKIKNFRHIVINNGAHESVGGQPTVGFKVDFPLLASASGYRHADRAESTSDTRSSLAKLFQEAGPAFLEIRARCGSRPDLGRPLTSPRHNKEAFMCQF